MKKILLIIVLLFTALPVQGAFAASGVFEYKFAAGVQIDTIEIEGTGKINSVNRYTSSGYDNMQTILSNSQVLPTSVSSSGTALVWGFIITGSDITSVTFKNGGKVVTPDLLTGSPLPTATPTPDPTQTPTPAGLLRGLPLNTYRSNGSSAAYGQNYWTDNNISTYLGLTTNNGYMEYTFASATNIKSYKLYTYSQSNTSYSSLMIRLYNGDDILKTVTVSKIDGTEVDLSTNNVTKIRVINSHPSDVNYISEFDVFGVLSAPTPTVTPTVTPTLAPTPTPKPTPTPSTEPTPSPTPTPVLKPTVDVVITPEKIGLGKEFTADISLKNVKDIYAEDFEVKYDKEHLQYLGFEEVTGYKVYNKPVDQNGAVRFIVASQGEEYGINKDTVIVKLKFKAKAKGTAVVDATKARIADTEEEYDLEKDNCLEDSIIIEAMDVNKSGMYTLVDLAIDARYFKYFAPDVDPVKYNAHQAGDEYVNDDDLLFIVDQILNNPDYLPNT